MVPRVGPTRRRREAIGGAAVKGGVEEARPCGGTGGHGAAEAEDKAPARATDEYRPLFYANGNARSHTSDGSDAD